MKDDSPGMVTSAEPAPAVAVVAQEWPLVGRDVELARLRDSLMAQACKGVLIAAPEGTGKTRLAVECFEIARRQGFDTARVTATVAASGVPLGALAPLIPADAPPGPAGPDRSELLRRSVQILSQRSSGSRLVLLVDDAHLLDDLSATVVHQLVLTSTAFVLATVRSGEPAPESILGLWKDGLVDRLDISAFTAETIHELLERVLGGQVDRRTAAHIAERTQGNALYLRELVLGALHDGALTAQHGVWHISGQSTPSARLTDLVEARIGRVTPDERELMELLAFGAPLGSAQIARLRDPETVERLEHHGLVTSRFAGRRLEVWLGHPLYGEVVRARTPDLRARTITRVLAESIEEVGARRREDVLRIGTWRLTAGGGHPGQLLGAAVTARWRYDFPLAERLARAALREGGGFEAALLAANLDMLQGRSGDAERELEKLAGEARTEEQRARVAIMRLDNILWSAGNLARADEIADSVAEGATDSSLRDEIMARRAWIIMTAGRERDALPLAEALLDRASGPPLVLGCFVASVCLLNQGKFSRALELADRGEAIQATLSEPMDQYPWHHQALRCAALQAAGRIDEATGVAQAQYEEALADNSPEAQANFAMHVARMELLRGRVLSSARMAQEATEVFRELGQTQRLVGGLGRAALALALGGQAQDAARLCAEAEALTRPGTPSAIELSRAWVSAVSGDLPHARQILRESAEAYDSRGHSVHAASSWHAMARLGGAADAADRLERLAQTMEGELVQTYAKHARALACGDVNGLAAVAARFEALGALLLAAEAAAEAAVHARRAGDQRNAVALERRAAILAARCEGATTPALQAIGVGAQLTGAERDTALLAAGGRSNRQIAEELCISVRTVESRLQSIYAKLGISRREQLKDAL
jgi:ATP/maltotriose-dependent transcriptional regulator MalT